MSKDEIIKLCIETFAEMQRYHSKRCIDIIRDVEWKSNNFINAFYEGQNISKYWYEYLAFIYSWHGEFLIEKCEKTRASINSDIGFLLSDDRNWHFIRPDLHLAFKKLIT